MRLGMFGVVLLLLVSAGSAHAQQKPPSATAAQAVTGEGVTGTLLRHAQFPSRHVAARNVDVWLPPGYDEATATRYPVLYMHDGQNVFDPSTSYTHVDWGVDEAMTRLIANGHARAAIVVAVWNTPKRLQEYMPRRAITGDTFVPTPGDPPFPTSDIVADDYLTFLVTELKPFIDAQYRTLTGPADTSVMGSSMGGLISAYAVLEYPDVFGGAGCVSTHWPIAGGIVEGYLAQHLPAPGGNRFYFDYGTEAIDAQYEPYQQRIDGVMRARGYRPGADLLSHRYLGATHNEAAWRARIEVPLMFLLLP
ncbi:MAG TPA: alpha/beta hydrolase-fold protein [Pseudoxanthomonas sp.]